MSLRTALTADLPLKLTSLALSLFLWFLAAGEEPESTLLDVVLSVQPPAGRTLLHETPPVRALVVGPRRELLKLSASPVRLSRVLDDTVAGDEVRLELLPGEVELPRGVNAHVQDVQPRTVTVDLDPSSERVVPVRPVVRVRDEEGFVAGETIVIPGTVRLFGPEVRLRAIDSVSTVPLQVRGAEGPIEQLLPLDAARLGAGVRVIPRRVTVRVEVEAVRERVFTGVPVRLSSVGAGRLAPARDTVTVRVRGRAGRLQALAGDSIVVLAEWAGADPPARVQLRVVLPAGISGRAEPDSIDLVPRRERG